MRCRSPDWGRSGCFGHGRISLCPLCGVGAEVLGVRAKHGPGPAHQLVCCSVIQHLLCVLFVVSVCDPKRPGAPRHGQSGWCDGAACPSSPRARRLQWGLGTGWHTAALRALSRRFSQRLHEHSRACRPVPLFHLAVKELLALFH